MLAMDEQIQKMNIEEMRVMAEATEVLENILLDENNPERCTKVGADLKEKTKQDLVRSLKKSTDVFAWSHEDMLGIDPSVITHRLNVYILLLNPYDRRKEYFPLRETMLLRKKCKSWPQQSLFKRFIIRIG